MMPPENVAQLATCKHCHTFMGECRQDILDEVFEKV